MLIQKSRMVQGSLFAGMGGFGLAGEWLGWTNAFNCEWDEFCKQVLKYYWPNAELYGDIDETDFTIWRGRIDVLSGGFPCQPYSTAGKRKGKEDNRHKWPQMLRAIREIQPRWVVGENVYGLVNWSRGLVFHEVQADLEAEGYEVWPYVLPACAVNAPHRRDRVWFIAHRNDYGQNSINSNNEVNASERGQYAQRDIIKSIEYGVTANPTSIRQQESWWPFNPGRSKEEENWEASWAYDDGRWPSESPFCAGNDGLPTKLAGITFRKWREESIKAAGNAIVPQVAYQIFKTIEQYENLNLRNNNPTNG